MRRIGVAMLVGMLVNIAVAWWCALCPVIVEPPHDIEMVAERTMGLAREGTG